MAWRTMLAAQTGAVEEGNKMKVVKLGEYGYEWAALGLSLSHERDASDMPHVMERLSGKGGGHDKFLESITTWWDVTAPRYWWQQADTYRVGVSKQSGSTMHTLTKRALTQSDFAEPVDGTYLLTLNLLIRQKRLDELKNALPEGYLQRRIVVSNYKALANIISQRRAHKLAEWQTFCQAVLAQVEHPELLPGA